MSNQHPELLRRHKLNPILAVADWPYPANRVFNPGATLLPDGTTLLLCRVEDRRVEVRVSDLPKLRNRGGLRSCCVIHASIRRESALSPDGISVRGSFQSGAVCAERYEAIRGEDMLQVKYPFPWRAKAIRATPLDAEDRSALCTSMPVQTPHAPAPRNSGYLP